VLATHKETREWLLEQDQPHRQHEEDSGGICRHRPQKAAAVATAVVVVVEKCIHVMLRQPTLHGAQKRDLSIKGQREWQLWLQC
jgi:hypothetical protein